MSARSSSPAIIAGTNGGIPPFADLRESNNSLRALFRSTTDGDGQQKPAFIQEEYESQQPRMALADNLFYNAAFSPLPSPALKLPPRLQAAGGEGMSPRIPHIRDSPKPSRKVSGLRRNDFDPFAAAVETIRKNDEVLFEPFYWRSLERSFKLSFARVLEGDELNEYELELAGGCARRNGRQKWNPFPSCFGPSRGIQ